MRAAAQSAIAQTRETIMITRSSVVLALATVTICATPVAMIPAVIYWLDGSNKAGLLCLALIAITAAACFAADRAERL